MAATVIEALRCFLPEFLHGRPPLNSAQRRAIWAITHCRTPMMGGHLHACEPCGTREFRFHSCNHRSCPQCGRAATVEWVQRELTRRVGAPYFMVTFTLPAQLRPLFFIPEAQKIYTLFPFPSDIPSVRPHPHCRPPALLPPSTSRSVPPHRLPPASQHPVQNAKRISVPPLFIGRACSTSGHSRRLVPRLRYTLYC